MSNFLSLHHASFNVFIFPLLCNLCKSLSFFLEITYTNIQKSFFYLFKVNSVGHVFVHSLLGEAVHGQAFSEVPVWTPGCFAKFSWLHSILLIATDLWKLGNRDYAT